MALALLLGGKRPLLVADDRALAPGIRLRVLEAAPACGQSPAELVAGGPGRVGRLLAGGVELQRCVLEVERAALRGALAAALVGISVGGWGIVAVELALAPSPRVGGVPGVPGVPVVPVPAVSVDLRLDLRLDRGEAPEDGGGNRRQWAGRLDFRGGRGRLRLTLVGCAVLPVSAGVREVLAGPGGGLPDSAESGDEAAEVGKARGPRRGDAWGIGSALLARLASLGATSGITAAGSSALEVDPLRLAVDRWLLRHGQRPLRPLRRPLWRVITTTGGDRLQIEIELDAGRGGTREVRDVREVRQVRQVRGSVTWAAPGAEVDAVELLENAIRDHRGDAAYRELADFGGVFLPEIAAWKIAGIGRPIPPGIAALELAAAAGSARAAARLPLLRGLRGLGGDRVALAAALLGRWRRVVHPIHRGRLRLAWALALGASAREEALRALEAVTPELTEGRWPAAVAGELWAAIARLRAGDPEIAPALAAAAAREADLHLGRARGAECFLEVAIELHERGTPEAEEVASQLRRAASATAEPLDPALRDELHRRGRPQGSGSSA